MTQYQQQKQQQQVNQIKIGNNIGLDQVQR